MTWLNINFVVVVFVSLLHFNVLTSFLFFWFSRRFLLVILSIFTRVETQDPYLASVRITSRKKSRQKKRKGKRYIFFSLFCLLKILWEAFRVVLHLLLLRHWQQPQQQIQRPVWRVTKWLLITRAALVA